MARHLRLNGAILALITLIALLAACTAVPRAASAQDAVPYTAVISRYLTGDADSAVLELSRWSRAEVSAAAKAWTRRPGAMPKQAAMLHTDLAYVLMIAGASATARFHLALAQGIVEDMARRERGHAPATPFAPRWLAFVASLYTAHGLLDEADQTLVAGLSLFPRDPMLYVVRGVTYETRAALNRPNGRGGGIGGNIPRRTPARLLDMAVIEFRHALELDPALAIASLHLGWRRFTTGDARAARDLDHALAHAPDDEVRYLARLIRGLAAERTNRVDDARMEFEAAMQAGARYQTAYVALSRAEEALGHSERARAIAQDYVQLTGKAEDPWWDFRLGGLSPTALRWLRLEARR